MHMPRNFLAYFSLNIQKIVVKVCLDYLWHWLYNIYNKVMIGRLNSQPNNANKMEKYV